MLSCGAGELNRLEKRNSVSKDSPVKFDPDSYRKRVLRRLYSESVL